MRRTEGSKCISMESNNRMPKRLTVLFPIIASLLFLILSGCSPPRRPPEPDNLFWPLPPDPPRIKYLRSLYSEDDIGRVYSFKEKLFGKDYFDSMLRPYGISARDGKIAVADIVMKRVLLFDLNRHRLLVVGEEGAMRHPSAVVLDREGTIYVSDAGGQRIVLYDAGGKYKTAFPLKGSKTVSLALNEKLGRLYVVDALGHKVIVLGLEGKRLFEFGDHGNSKGQFNLPLDITIDREGTVYVLDVRNFRVQVFDPEGTFITSFGSAGDGPGLFANPKGIAADSDGHIYVTDAAFSNFQVFDRTGRVLLFVGGLGSRPGEMFLPAGISIDEQDRLYVADQLNKRVQIFQYIRNK